MLLTIAVTTNFISQVAMVVKRCETIVAPRGEGLWRYLKMTGCSSYLRIKKSRKNTTGITNEKDKVRLEFL